MESSSSSSFSWASSGGSRGRRGSQCVTSIIAGATTTNDDDHDDEECHHSPQQQRQHQCRYNKEEENDGRMTCVVTEIEHQLQHQQQHQQQASLSCSRSNNNNNNSNDDNAIHIQKRCVYLAAISLLLALSFFIVALSSGVRPAKRMEKMTSTSPPQYTDPTGVIASHYYQAKNSGDGDDDDDDDAYNNDDGDNFDDDDDNDESYYNQNEIDEQQQQQQQHGIFTQASSPTSTEEQLVEDDQAQLDLFQYSTSSSSSNEKKNQNNAAVNNGKECSVVTPVDYTQKFQHGTGYEGIPGFQCYRTVDGTRQTVNDLLVKYPLLTSRVFLGNYRTAELGQRLSALVITNQQSNLKNSSAGSSSTSSNNNSTKGKLLVVSSIHARELTTAETMTRFAEYLLQNYGIDPDVTWILDYMEIHLILHANPDGRVYLEKGGEHTLWKKNRNNVEKCGNWQYGVDPNRNFPFKWGECDNVGGGSRQICTTSSQCKSVVYRGPTPKSEVETKAILEYAASIFPVEQRKGNLQVSEANYNTPFGKSSEGVFIDVHSHGQYVGWPWGFINQRTPNDEGLGALGRKLASFNGYGLWAPKMPKRQYGFDGGTIDTMYGWLGVASYFFELGTSFYQPCDTFPTVINEVFPALLYAAKVSKEPYMASKGPDILCTTISVTNTTAGKYVNAEIEVSDSARTKHVDDGGDDDDGNIFFPGRQTIASVEIFVNCHPYSGPGCQPTNRKVLANAGTSITVSMRFKAPTTGRKTNVMYIRATDSANYKGPVTARSFVV